MMNEPGTETYKDFFTGHRQHFFGYEYDNTNWLYIYRGTRFDLEIKKSLFNIRTTKLMSNVINSESDSGITQWNKI